MRLSSRSTAPDSGRGFVQVLWIHGGSYQVGSGCMGGSWTSRTWQILAEVHSIRVVVYSVATNLECILAVTNSVIYGSIITR